ncbi:MAG: hydroxylamine reductase, partial [Sedimentibacter sp.]
MENAMFCYQCQETAGCTGCTKVGVCGKSPEVARMQDLLIYTTKGLSEVTTRLRKEGKEVSADVNHLVTLNLFTTITNANFDNDVFYDRVKMTLNTKNELLNKLGNKENLSEAALWTGNSNEELDAKSKTVGVLTTQDEDVRSLRELITYGLKGMSAYVKHANALGYDEIEVNAFMQETLAKLLDDSLAVGDLVALTLETGKFGVNGMALLDKANTSTYG